LRGRQRYREKERDKQTETGTETESWRQTDRQSEREIACASINHELQDRVIVNRHYLIRRRMQKASQLAYGHN